MVTRTVVSVRTTLVIGMAFLRKVVSCLLVTVSLMDLTLSKVKAKKNSIVSQRMQEVPSVRNWRSVCGIAAPQVMKPSIYTHKRAMNGLAETIPEPAE